MSWGNVAGAGIGAGIGLLGGSRQAGTTTQTSAPWGPQQGYLTDIYGRAQQASNQPPSPYSTQAIAQMAAQAQDPNSLVAGAQRNLSDTLGGRYLDFSSNPYAQSLMNAAQRQVSGQFSGENFRSSANQGWLAKQTTEAAAPIYQMERQNQMTGLAMAPGLQMANIAQLGQAGAMEEAQRWSPLERYMNLISGNVGGSTTSPYFNNPWASALGGGLAGLQLSKGLGLDKWNPFGGGVAMEGGGTTMGRPDYVP